jgi:hypothetical protein
MKPSRLITLVLFSFLLHAVFAQNTTAKYSVKNIKANTKHSDYGTSFLAQIGFILLPIMKQLVLLVVN